MLEKWLKSGSILQCPNSECKHKVKLAAGEPTAPVGVA
jgi:hypothetical protein